MRRLARALPARRRDEQGVMAVVVAIITCFALIPLAAFAVDIGAQRVLRRDAQAVADSVALDLSRRLDGRTYGVLNPLMQGYADASANRSELGGGGEFDVSVQLGSLATSFDPDAPENYFQPFTSSTATSTVVTAVKVTATGKAGFNFVGGTGRVSRSAIGSANSQACMTMDSYAAALKSGASTLLGPLNRLLGTSIDTTVLGSSGILSTDLEVLGFLNVLKTQLGVGGFDEVLSANLTAAQIVAAQVAALNAQGATAAAQALQSQIGLHVPSGTQINVGQLLGVTQGGLSGLAATVNPLDLAAAAVTMANGTNPIHLTATGTNLTGLSLDARVGSRPTTVCLGQGTVTRGQTTLTASADINAPGTLTNAVVSLQSALSGLLGGVLGAIGGLLGGDTYSTPVVTLGRVTAQLSLASASGRVNSVNCVDGEATGLQVNMAASLLPAVITIPLTVRETRTYGPLWDRKSETVTSTLSVTISTNPTVESEKNETLAIPGDSLNGKEGPNGNLSVGNTTLTTTMTSDGTFSNGRALVGTLLSGLSSVTTSLQNNLLTPLASTIVTPLLNSLTSALQSQLGLTIAGSRYRPHDDATCRSPKLSG